MAERAINEEMTMTTKTHNSLARSLALGVGAMLIGGVWTLFSLRNSLLSGVKSGIAAALYIAHFEAAERTRQSRGEASWILETSEAMPRGLGAVGGRLVKKPRI